jgi:aminopeptidase YwaD
MMVTDTAFLRNPNYHKSGDRIETLDILKMAMICEGLVAGLSRL